MGELVTAFAMVGLAACSFSSASQRTDGSGDDGDDGAIDARATGDGGGGSDGPVDASRTSDAAFDPATCPAGYLPLAGLTSRYRVHPTADTMWAAARTACDADAPGDTHLVVLDDVAELNAVRVATAPQFQWTHIGIHRVAGQLELVYGGAPSYLPWSTGEPGASPGKPAGDAVSLDPSDASIFDVPLNWGFAYVCECDGRPTVFD